jgi:hypothetical protein
LSLNRQHQAGEDRPSIHEDGATTTGPIIATLLGSGQIKFLPQNLQ